MSRTRAEQAVSGGGEGVPIRCESGHFPGFGRVAEWSIAPVLKTGNAERRSRVRIPPLPLRSEVDNPPFAARPRDFHERFTSADGVRGNEESGTVDLSTTRPRPVTRLPGKIVASSSPGGIFISLASRRYLRMAFIRVMCGSISFAHRNACEGIATELAATQSPVSAVIMHADFFFGRR
jgi:hypothetical protein